MAATDKLTLVAEPMAVVQGETTKLTATLVDNANQPIGQTKVSFEQSWPGDQKPAVIKEVPTSDQGIAICQFTVENSFHITAERVTVSAKTAEGIAAKAVEIIVFATTDQKNLKEKQKQLKAAKNEQQQKNQEVQELAQAIETLEKQQQPPAAIEATKVAYKNAFPALQKQVGEIQTLYQQAEQMFTAQFTKPKVDKIANAYTEIGKEIEAQQKKVTQLQQEVDKLKGQLEPLQTDLNEKAGAWATTLNIRQKVDEIEALKTQAGTINKGIKDGIAEGKNKEVAAHYRQLLDTKEQGMQSPKLIVQPPALESSLLTLWKQLNEQTKLSSERTQQKAAKEEELAQAKAAYEQLKAGRDDKLKTQIEAILNDGA